MNMNNNGNNSQDIRNMPLGQNTYDQYPYQNQEFRGENPQYNQYYNQGMPMGNMNVNLNGNLQQNVDTGFLSKIALVLAILSILCCCIDWLFSIPAVICAIIALIKNKKDTCAWAALVIAGLSVIVYIFAALTGLIDDATSSVKDKAEQTKKGQSTSKDIVSEDNTDDEDSSDEKIEFYNNNGIVIYYKGNTDDWMIFSYKEFKIYVENNSDNDIKVKLDKFIINKYKVHGSMSLEVESGLRGNDTISVSQSTLDDNDITEIESIEGTFTIYKSGTDDIIDTFDFEIKSVGQKESNDIAQSSTEVMEQSNTKDFEEAKLEWLERIDKTYDASKLADEALKRTLTLQMTQDEYNDYMDSLQDIVDDISKAKSIEDLNAIEERLIEAKKYME